MEELDRIKHVELSILKTVIDLLEKNSIKWYLLYGSCLGAIRHNGFIPWDDDIDIGLMRKDYEKARSILIKELPADYIFCDRMTELDYPYNFAKVRKNNTAYVHPGDSHLNIHHGIYIDIFPLDNCPANINEFGIMLKRVNNLRQRIDLSCMAYYKGTQRRPVWQMLIIAISHLLFNKKTLQKNLDDLLISQKEHTGWVCSFLGDYGEKARVKEDWFGEGRQIPFEGIPCRVPTESNLYLKKLYGDYMILPPENERTPRHDTCYISTMKNYKRVGDK